MIGSLAEYRPVAMDQTVRLAFDAVIEDGTSVSQLHYEYSGAALDQLRERVLLPARLKTAVLRRQADFLAGRLCARRALLAAGFEGDTEIATSEHGAPIWPIAFRGSISHCDGFAIASVGHARRFAAIGIDIERRISADVVGEIRRQVASTEELSLGSCNGMSPETWLTLLFSGKESLFKALYPDVGRHFDFLDATATHLDACAGTFTLCLRVALSPRHPQGSTYAIRFLWSEGHVLTHCILPV